MGQTPSGNRHGGGGSGNAFTPDGSDRHRHHRRHERRLLRPIRRAVSAPGADASATAAAAAAAGADDGGWETAGSRRGRSSRKASKERSVAVPANVLSLLRGAAADSVKNGGAGAIDNVVSRLFDPAFLRSVHLPSEVRS